VIRIQVTAVDGGARAFLVSVTGTLTKRRELNEALAIRLRRELKDHFAIKNREPNKMNAPKSNFWRQVADATDIAEVTDSGATVAVAEQRFNIQLFGGTIFPRKAKALTIPVIVEARGESVASYRLKTGKRLFTIPGRNMLFEKADNGGATESRLNFTRGRDRSFGVKLGARQGLRGVFALARSANIKADPTALPRAADLLVAMQEEADDFMDDVNEGRLA
jgi:hypothetical protein